MARQQVEYNPRAEALQTTAAPNIKAVQARFDPRGSTAFQLAEALGTPLVQQELAKMKEVQDKEMEAAGRAYANSRTVAELNKDVQEGRLLPTSNPVFKAAVNHTYGENAVNSLFNDTVSKMNRGELVFEDDPEGAPNRKTGQQKLDEFLVGERNKMLAGQDRFAIAGFDKKWNTFREQVIDANNKALDKRFQERGLATASQGFATVYDEAQKAGLKPEDTAAKVMEKYDLFRNGSVLRTPDQQKQGLKAAAMAIAATGDQATLKALLDSNLPNNGPKVRFFLDSAGQDATILEKNAEGIFDKKQREEADNGLAPHRAKAATGDLDENEFKKFWEPRQKYLGSATIQSIIQQNNAAIAQKAREIDKIGEEAAKARENDLAVQQAEAAIASGRPVQDITTADGRTLKAQDIGAAAMAKILAANPNMSPQEVIRRHALAGIKMPTLEREMTVATANIGETTLDANGKPTGQLMPATIEALDKFAVARQVSEGYARELAGSERNYETLVHIQALREEGINDVNLAAALVNQKNRRNLPPSVWGNIQKSVNDQIENITNPGVFTGRFWGEVFRGEFGEGERNLIVVKGAVRRLAETYLASGVAADAEQAVTKAAEYFADNRVSTQINGTIYLNKDLPELPQGMDRTKWFSKAMDGLVGSRLSAQGIKYNRSDLTLIPMEGGNRPFMISLRGIPTGQYITREEIKSWIMTESDKEDQKLIDSKKPQPRPVNTRRGTQGDPTLTSPFESEAISEQYRNEQRGKR